MTMRRERPCRPLAGKKGLDGLDSSLYRISTINDLAGRRIVDDHQQAGGFTMTQVHLPREGRRAGARRADDAEVARFAKALGHPARVAIVRLLATSGTCVCGDIVDQLPLAQATVSQHLKVLKEAGLIRGNVDPPRVCYCIDPTGLARAKALFADL
jgi:DNA-binding HxlR family transcriptional regulator